MVVVVLVFVVAFLWTCFVVIFCVFVLAVCV